MTSGSALFDTNILIDLFSGRREAKQALEAWPPQNAISLITWMEVMVGAKKYHQEQRTRMALSTFNIINISQDIAERSVALRQEYKLKRKTGDKSRPKSYCRTYSPSPGNMNGLIELLAKPSCSMRASSTREAKSSATASTFGSFS